MIKKKVKGSFVILNDKGLHTRPATELVRCASHYRAEIMLLYRTYAVNAKSILGILMLAAEKGDKIEIEAIGQDATDAIGALCKLAQNRFNIRY